ncbi:hypothetical protein PLESTB_000585300 [Pleodorina starrii]|uniref:Tafazzin family protein n=1 Tax=Pleodorina starrii TaxID=330485 RepID=A0A9W6F0S4_9CHLO|nr:hypothetical protein PLESTM_000299500 [Pleodorina starrii]GLC52122.1 hypothetical protein PLESTB_000585300 [Pleodorina starrii]
MSTDEASPSRKLQDEVLAPPWGGLGRSITLGLVSSFARLILTVLNKTEIINQERLISTVENRESGAGVLTICNHTSMFDDPGVLSIIMPWSWLWMDPVQNHVRWSLCAKEVCFKNELLRQFFLSGKTLPVERGKGVQQPMVSVAAAALASGQWVHVFPEGRINYDGRLGPLRWGAGKLVCEARSLAGGRDPTVLPFYHSNMGSVLPLWAKGFSVGHKVEVRVGEPVQLADLTCRCDSSDLGEQQEAWRLITERMRGALQELEAQSPPNPNQSGKVPPPGKEEPPPS